MRRIFYLNLGEPFLSPPSARNCRSCAPKIPTPTSCVSTNGMLLNTDAKREAALNLSDILFSVHGISDAMCEKYMLRGSFEKAFDAMKQMAAFRDARGLTLPVLEWKYLLFNWNDHPQAIARAIEMAKEIKRGHHFLLADPQSILRNVLALSFGTDESHRGQKLERARSDIAPESRREMKALCQKWGLPALTLLTFFLLLGSRALNEPDEGRYSEVAREMIETGDWLVPHLWYLPHLDKPPMTYWLVAASMEVFGQNEWAARLPIALAGISGVWAAFLLGRSLGGRRAGLWSALILQSSSCSISSWRGC